MPYKTKKKTQITQKIKTQITQKIKTQITQKKKDADYPFPPEALQVSCCRELEPRSEDEHDYSDTQSESSSRPSGCSRTAEKAAPDRPGPRLAIELRAQEDQQLHRIDTPRSRLVDAALLDAQVRRLA